jgi:hypothetical protein
MDSPPPPMSPPAMDMQSYSRRQPLFDIEDPTNNDVLCGRGVTTNRHVGNENFRSLVNCNKVRFQIPVFRRPYTNIDINLRNVGTTSGTLSALRPFENSDESLKRMCSLPMPCLSRSLSLASSFVLAGALRVKHEKTKNEDFSLYC